MQDVLLSSPLYWIKFSRFYKNVLCEIFVFRNPNPNKTSKMSPQETEAPGDTAVSTVW